jgi:small-conductance mechanosensitive channel
MVSAPATAFNLDGTSSPKHEAQRQRQPSSSFGLNPPSAATRSARIACALRARLAEIGDEMDSALRQREQAYRLGDAFLDEFDDLAESAERLRAELHRLELRLQQMGAYFISEAQAEAILNEIAEAGVDLPRFCDSLGVDGIARIPAHRLGEALAALDANRRRAAV